MTPCLPALPYDLLLNICQYLDLPDVQALHLTSRHLNQTTTTRPIYRSLALSLLIRCRPLPLPGFSRIVDLSRDELRNAVGRAWAMEVQWAERAPRPRWTKTLNSAASGVMDDRGITTYKPTDEAVANLLEILNGHVNGSAARVVDGTSTTPAAPTTADVLAASTTDISDTLRKHVGTRSWYRTIHAPPDEQVDWLSPITSIYTLCATKSGKVYCWDVVRDAPLIHYDAGPKWELWKCRVEFDDATVFFAMAKVREASVYDDDRVMDFTLMRLSFPLGTETTSTSPPSHTSVPRLPTSGAPPTFTREATFRTSGVVMNVFLLDPRERLLAAFIWGSKTDTIGLFVVFDWKKQWDSDTNGANGAATGDVNGHAHGIDLEAESRGEYVFIDTGIICKLQANWSCILYDETLVVHCEEADGVKQHFYPIPLLKTHLNKVPPGCDHIPRVGVRVPPAYSISSDFDFPTLTRVTRMVPLSVVGVNVDVGGAGGGGAVMLMAAPQNGANGATIAGMVVLPQLYTFVTSRNTGAAITDGATADEEGQEEEEEEDEVAPPADNGNPFPCNPWYPESAHFVRQWWPTLPSVPRMSCTVVLLAAHDHAVNRHKYVLAQHYFSVPLKGHQDLDMKALEDSAFTEAGAEPTCVPSSGMPQWYVSTPFEVVCVVDWDPENPGVVDDDGHPIERPRPLLAVDFGCAVWVEYVDGRNEDGEDAAGESGDMEVEVDMEAKWLRFVAFPAIGDEDYGTSGSSSSSSLKGKGSEKSVPVRRDSEGIVRTLQIPEELELGAVETINIDQSQGAVILSVKDGRIFILGYE